MLKRTFFLFWVLCFFALLPAQAQNITGIWRGYFITNGSEQYKFEIQINQKKTNQITGVSYSYLDTRFYGKATLTGLFNNQSDAAQIQEIKTVEVRMSGSSVACIMKCSFQYSKSGDEEFLEGTYTSAYEKNDTLLGIRRGGNCGGGKLFLRKVPTSDFYVEPFLRTNPAVDKPSSTLAKKTPVPVKKATTPATKPPVASSKKPVPTKVPPVQKKRDSVATVSPTLPPVVQKKAPLPERPALKLPTVTRSRTNELLQTLTVSTNNIQVKLYDNGEIDDDTISVYLDNKLVLASKRLSTAPLTLNLEMTATGEEHVLVMVAENLGRIPPNTSLMIVNDGEKRYEVRVTSTEQKNAMVRFRYKPQNE